MSTSDWLSIFNVKPDPPALPQELRKQEPKAVSDKFDPHINEKNI